MCPQLVDKQQRPHEKVALQTKTGILSAELRTKVHPPLTRAFRVATKESKHPRTTPRYGPRTAQHEKKNEWAFEQDPHDCACIVNSAHTGASALQ